MSDTYNRSMLNQRFLRIVDLILEENEKDGKSPSNDSQLSHLISDGTDRTLIYKIRSNRKSVTHGQIEKLANAFSIDFNAFYRNIEVITFGRSDYWEEGRILILKSSSERGNEDAINDLIQNLESSFKKAGDYIDGIPEEFRDSCTGFLDGIEAAFNRYKEIMGGELILLERINQEHTNEVLNLTVKLNEARNKRERHLPLQDSVNS